PAKINHVSVVDMQEKHLEVIVDDTQLSLAIGKKGQNVRLAAKLLGWHIDIKSEEEKRQEIESQMAAMALRGAPISELKGLGEKTLQKLRDHGIQSVEQLAQMTPEDLTQIQGIGDKTVEKIRKVVTDYFERDSQAATAGSEGVQETVAGEGNPESASVETQDLNAQQSDELPRGEAAATGEDTTDESAELIRAQEPESPAPEGTGEPPEEGEETK